MTPVTSSNKLSKTEYSKCNARQEMISHWEGSEKWGELLPARPRKLALS